MVSTRLDHDSLLIFEVNPIVIDDDVLAHPQTSASNNQKSKRKRENIIDVLGRQSRSENRSLMRNVRT